MDIICRVHHISRIRCTRLSSCSDYRRCCIYATNSDQVDDLIITLQSRAVLKSHHHEDANTAHHIFLTESSYVSYMTDLLFLKGLQACTSVNADVWRQLTKEIAVKMKSTAVFVHKILPCPIHHSRLLLITLHRTSCAQNLPRKTRPICGGRLLGLPKSSKRG
ncbi:hypothetical protein BDQ17DRAFT_235832 [Cyathus striatus]|nr:hypothetical protein BDQ17DRAFT_235832 [Cyathus striatus]